ncbi:hypothetical protein NHX12_024339 [Muraenolepis orangiensis]|uniref:Serine/threonine-protein phosphatase 1 regulatory subunit 10 n=1 Tax=Muraenolepis orangiensis TaxID=630683 RepID=A0A9Q0EM62_9TELE|nr:hypothetical protein NHX12_024339 [Muraenolepis orangiensis]
MAVGPVDPREILKGVESLLGKDGELRSLEGVPKVFSLMKASTKMVSRCMYLNILLQTKSHDILNRFIRVGGYKLLNAWLTYSKTTTNTPLLQLILLTLQKLPLKVDHLKQNNTAKLVKQLSKSGETEELRKLATVLVEGWMAIIRSQSVPSSGTSPADKKKKEGKVPLREMKPLEEDKKKEKPKAHAPSHAKIRSIGLEIETPTPALAKKTPAALQLGDKYNIKPAVLKRPSTGPSDAPPLWSIKKKKPGSPASTSPSAKAVSPTSNKPNPFEAKPSTYGSLAKPSSPEDAAACPAPSDDIQDLEPPGTPVPADDPEAADNAEKPNALAEPRHEEEPLTKKGKKKKSVRWAEEEQLKEYFYFDLDETERVNVNKIKDFGEAAKRELMMDRQTFEMSRRLSHDAMEERVPWTPPRPFTLTGSLVQTGSSSTEKLTQRDREMGILQEIFLSKDSVPDSPHEPDQEVYEPMPPRVIPLDEDSSMPEDSYMEPMDTTAQHAATMCLGEGAKLPPELLSSIMGAQGNQSTEDLIKQPDFSDKIKQLLGSLQQSQNQNGPPPVNPGLLGHVPMNNMNNMNNMPMPMNGYPPNQPPGAPRFTHPPPPHNHGPPFNAGPRMMGPPPGHADNGGNYWGDDSMRGGPPRGGHFHRGGRGRGGGEPGFRGRGSRGGPRGGHNMNDMSKRPVCRHFMMKGNCRYESNCAFYHPGVNGPPLPPNHPAHSQHPPHPQHGH